MCYSKRKQMTLQKVETYFLSHKGHLCSRRAPGWPNTSRFLQMQQNARIFQARRKALRKLNGDIANIGDSLSLLGPWWASYQKAIHHFLPDQ